MGIATYRQQAEVIFSDIATKELLPAGFIKHSASTYIRQYPKEAITHVVYIYFDRGSRIDSAHFEIRSAVVLEDHPHTKLITNQNHKYKTLHYGRFGQNVAPSLKQPRKDTAWPSLAILDAKSSVNQVSADVLQVTRQHLKYLDRWFMKRKRWLLRYMLYVKAGIHRSLHMKLSLGYYYAAQEKPEMVDRIERSLREANPKFVARRGMPDFYNPQ